MKSLVLVPLLAFLPVAAIPAATPQQVYTPAEAVALARTTGNGRSGRFAMVVVTTGTTPNGTFLNSTSDYRAPDNLTFRLSPMVAAMLAKRYGAPAADALRGKRVTVDGKVVEKPIANTRYGRPESLNRFQHQVDVTQVSQLVGVEAP